MTDSRDVKIKMQHSHMSFRERRHFQGRGDRVSETRSVMEKS